MSTHKRRPGNGKSQTASDAAKDLIPEDIRELLGPSPVVDIVEEPIFERLLAAAVSELNPSGIIEWTTVFDFVVTIWEIRQLREYRTSFLRIENARYSTYRETPETKTPEQIAIDEKYSEEFSKAIRDQSHRDMLRIVKERVAQNSKAMEEQSNQPRLRNLKHISTGETDYDRAFRMSQVIANQAQTIDHLQKMILMLERRRDTLLRDLDRRQAARLESQAARLHKARSVTDLQSEVRG